MVALPPLRSDPRCPPELFLRSIVTFRYTSYDSTSGIPTLIVLRFVGDRPDDVAGVEADSRSECRECCDEHRDDDFQNLFPVHSCVGFQIRCKGRGIMGYMQENPRLMDI